MTALATSACITLLWSRPFDFYTQWLYTHPRLRPQTRENTPKTPRPDMKLLVLLLAIIVIGPILSTTLSMIAVVVLSLVAIYRAGDTPGVLLTEGVNVLTPYLSYGGPDSFAPGVWQPPVPHQQRMRITSALFVPYFFTLVTGLTLFMPLGDLVKWDLLWKARPAGTGSRWTGLVSEAPEWWVPYVWHKIYDQNQPEYIWTVPIALAIGFLLAPLAIAAIFRTPLRHALQTRLAVDGFVRADGSREPGLDEDERVEWQWYLDRLADSPHVAQGPLGENVHEAGHLFLGVEPHARFPVLLDEKILSEHAYIVGDSGSGKTSLGLMPMLIQLIRGHRPTVQDQDSGRAAEDGLTHCPPIVVIDLKGDRALFETVRREAEQRGQEFRFFNPEKDRVSHYFNPFQSLESKYRTDVQLCHLLLDALSLNHGEGYGRGYYSRQSRQLLFDALADAEKSPTDGTPAADTRERTGSLDELYNKIIKMREKEQVEYKDTLELLSTIHVLKQYKNLAFRTNPNKPESAIHMPSVLERRQVVYFWLPAAVESISVREIAKLALYSLLTACIDRQRSHPNDKRQAYVFIDEFQRIAGENFRVILEQARSFGLGVVLSNQSIADLKTPDVDLRPTVRTNTRFKRYFSLTDPDEVRALSEASGEELMYVRSWGQTTRAPYSEHVWEHYQNRSDSQSLKPRLTRNDIASVSDHPLDSIIHVSRGSGYTQFAGAPIPVRCTWPYSRGIYEERQQAPWPTREEYEEGTITTNETDPLDRERERLAATHIHAFNLMQSLNAQGV